MALTYCFLASGSSGNCLWVRGAGTELLIDCGISARQVQRRLEEIGANLADVQGVVCTHGHADHIAGAPVLVRRHHLHVWATAGALRSLPGKVPAENQHPLPCGGGFAVGGLSVRTVPTPHDSPESVALIISDGETSLGVVTDLGTPTEALAQAFRGVDGLVLEMNHDPQMLADGPYPEHLKRRIRGNFGHLSNEQGAALLAQVLHPGLQHLTLAHLSEHNNTPDKARAVAEALLQARGTGPTPAVAEPHRPGTPVQLGVRRGQQLALW